MKFLELFKNSAEYFDVLSLIPTQEVRTVKNTADADIDSPPEIRGARSISKTSHPKLGQRPTYGNPLHFRGLRHEPVNEQGVVFLFGMVAHQMNYIVESVQQGFPDCEAKRKIKNGQWEPVSIEFEFDSNNFRDHGHPIDGCDIIVCRRHNWPDCPTTIEILELSKAVERLSR